MRGARGLILVLLALGHSVSVSAQTHGDRGATVLLAASQDPGADEALRRALLDPDAGVRLAAARVIGTGNRRPLLPDLIGALAREQDRLTGAELLRNVLFLGGADPALIAQQASRLGPRAILAEAEWLGRTQPAQFIAALPGWSQTEGVTKGLGRLVRMAAIQHPAQRAELLSAWKPLAPKADSNTSRDGVFPGQANPSGMRTIELPGDRLAAATIAAAGCRPTDTSIGLAKVLYWPDGRPRKIELDAGLSDKCLAGFSALVRLSLAGPDDAITDTPATIVMPFHSAFLDCASPQAPESPAVEETRPVDRDIKVPQKTRDVKPFYPAAAQQKGIQGVVIIEATISKAGCINEARVLRSIPLLDLPAMWSVTQWTFTPTIIDDTPVPVIMTVTVNFTLR